MISFGVCCGPDQTAMYAEAGFDYFECNIATVFQGEKPDSEVNCAGFFSKAVLPCRAGNGFVPGSLKICGPDADFARLKAYAENAIRRAASCGLETLVFGSGGARQCPDGFPKEVAAQQIRRFLEDMLPALDKYGITVAIEPLCDCNMVPSVASGAALVHAVAHPRVRLLADSFHFLKTDNELDSLTWAAPLLQHIHLATMQNRLAPGAEDCDLVPFLSVLKHGGYSGRLSLECWKMPANVDEARASLAYLRSAWDSIR